MWALGDERGANSMSKPWIALTVGLCLTGAANAQTGPGDPTAGPAASYAVEGLVLGSKVKLGSSMYREYKCGPSEQFDGFTWCQKTSRESERRGSFEASYSILHAKDGTVVYANRTQQPAFFGRGETDSDIQNYTRKIGEAPRITKVPLRSGALDAVLATWGGAELEPLDDDSVKVLAEGKSPKKGFLIDFLGNFARSAQEGLPIYRIIGGPGFVWVASFDRKGRGTLRFAAVDASAFQPGLAATPPAAAPPSPAAAPPAPAATQPAAVTTPPEPPAATQPAPPAAPRPPDVPREAASTPRHEEQRPSPSGVELAAVMKAKEDAEAAVARLRAELAQATREKTEAEIARADAQRLAQQARRDAEIARKEFEAATNDANAAKDEIERLKADGGKSPTYVKEAVLSGLFTALVLLLGRLVFFRMRGSSPKEPAVPERTDDEPELRKDDVEGALIPLSTASVGPAETEPSIDQDDLVKQLAKTLGVEDSAPPFTPNVPIDADGDQPPIGPPEQAAAKAPDAQGPMPSERLPDAQAISSAEHDREEAARSSVPATASSEAGAAKSA
jgi:hypothetical protein